MKAALLYEPKKIEISEIDAPQLGENEVMIKPKYVGICGSDVSLFTGHRTAYTYPLLRGGLDSTSYSDFRNLNGP